MQTRLAAHAVRWPLRRSTFEIWWHRLVALTMLVTIALEPLDAMQAARVKAALMQTILWSHPDVKKGQF